MEHPKSKSTISFNQSDGSSCRIARRRVASPHSNHGKSIANRGSSPSDFTLISGVLQCCERVCWSAGEAETQVSDVGHFIIIIIVCLLCINFCVIPARYEIERQWSGRYIDHPRNPATIEISLTCAGNLREKAHSVLRG